jgi:hypothetical protein
MAPLWDDSPHRRGADVSLACRRPRGEVLDILPPRAATCWQPEVKGLTMMTNSQYNGWRFEDVWLDK